ncbi:adenylate/guanylate cyclase domain-containing protein [Reyranella sp.]|uniref:adenylate/guanylate cyclase domain-containing protein n=1 Tax=Reyranella sp. TaxID=1929291 RepID=UPI00121802D8|nr:adenylate/guanylate cyclase domain-containing protein [Reyranella sp.]TAJ84252.1 MAG: adenylate/guanylate cyclase domain-containing protein [Reyranella sp.]
MKRKAGLFLLAVLVVASLMTMIVASLAMYRLVAGAQAEELRKIEASLSERFAVFELMLQSENRRNHRHMETVLPRIAADVERAGRDPRTLSFAEMDALATQYGIGHLYFIDRDYKVFQTNLPSDLDLVLPKGRLTDFLDRVMGSGKAWNAGIDLSLVTHTLKTYSYFGPADRDYIIEASTDVRETLQRSDFAWMGKYFFEEFFADAMDSNPYVRDVDVYLVSSTGAWSLIHVGEQLAPAIVEKVLDAGRYRPSEVQDRLTTRYSVFKAAGADGKGDGPGAMVMIRKVVFDLGLARQAVVHVFVSSLVVLALMLPLIYWLAARLLQRQILDPLFTLRREAGAIAEGDLDQPIANVERRDEIGQLARSFTAMRDAVRATITDLKETNLSIERFVPRAFLAKIGRPNIRSVALGDNKRQDMTILFADIRNFTALSERMSPDANFAFINAYLAEMGPVIAQHGGFIDKYIGDAIMALFEKADDGVRAGLAMLAILERFNATRQATGAEPIVIGIGLNTGSLMMGTIGERHRMDGTVISDAVNLAARLESLTKDYRVPLLVSQFTVDRLDDPETFALRPIDTVVVRGRTQPVAIFEVQARQSSIGQAPTDLA